MSNDSITVWENTGDVLQDTIGKVWISIWKSRLGFY